MAISQRYETLLRKFAEQQASAGYAIRGCACPQAMSPPPNALPTP